MSDDSVLELARAVRDDVAGLKDDVLELRGRVGLLESQGASLSRRLDRVAGDVEQQIKQRLNLVDEGARLARR